MANETHALMIKWYNIFVQYHNILPFKNQYLVSKYFIMKKIFSFIAFLAFSTMAMAQQESQKEQPNDDQLQQQPPKETQAELERAAVVENRKKELEEKQDEKAIERKKALKKRNKANDTVTKPKKPVAKPNP